MMKTLKNVLKQDRERYKVPRSVQDVIPIRRIWEDGVFLVGNLYTKSYKFTDINYQVASREDKESMFLTYSELLNSLSGGATTKITINNHRVNQQEIERSLLMALRGDPPRDGVAKKALEKILSYGVESIVYVSCKPSSLARDIPAFHEAGYRVSKMAAVDMFPFTAQVEVVCFLSKA